MSHRDTEGGAKGGTSRLKAPPPGGRIVQTGLRKLPGLWRSTRRMQTGGLASARRARGMTTCSRNARGRCARMGMKPSPICGRYEASAMRRISASYDQPIADRLRSAISLALELTQPIPPSNEIIVPEDAAAITVDSARQADREHPIQGRSEQPDEHAHLWPVGTGGRRGRIVDPKGTEDMTGHEISPVARPPAVTYQSPKTDHARRWERITAVFQRNCGGPPGDRTQDTVIKSHVLYH
jgi:hypothetical protein